jgi:hypothetical protein
MIKYSWEINKLTTVNKSELSDVIEVVHWCAEATDNINVVHEVGEVELDPPNSENFTKFSNLSKHTILGWLQNSIDTVAIQNNLNTRLKELQG